MKVIIEDIECILRHVREIEGMGDSFLKTTRKALKAAILPTQHRKDKKQNKMNEKII